MRVMDGKTLRDREIFVPYDIAELVSTREFYKSEALFQAVCGDKKLGGMARVMAGEYQRQIDVAIRGVSRHVQQGSV